MGKPKMNGYSLFAKELQNSNPARFKTLEQAISAADPLWKAMSDEEKEEYKRRAKRMNSNVKTADEVRVNSSGTTFKQIKEEKLRNTAMREKMIEEIKDTFVDAEFGEMIEQRFFVAHLNYHLAPPTVEEVVPAELAILEFNLKNGLTRCFHRLIDAGEIKQGYYLAAKEQSEKTHKLFPQMIGVNSKMELYYDIMAFITNRNKEMRAPIIYAMPEDTALNDSLVALRGLLKHLQDFVNRWEPVQNKHVFRVYPLPTFLYLLYNDLVDKYASELDNISESYAHSMLTKDTYMYLSGGTFCEFHEKDENVYCSRSKVVRCAFLIFEHTLPLLKIIKPIKGYHLPAQDNNMKDTMRRIEKLHIPLWKYYPNEEEEHLKESGLDRFVSGNRNFPQTAHSSRSYDDYDDDYVDSHRYN